MAEKLTPMMQQYFEVRAQIFSPMFSALFADFFQSKDKEYRSADVRQKTLILARVGITKGYKW